MTSHERIVEWNGRSRGDDFNVGSVPDFSDYLWLTLRPAKLYVGPILTCQSQVARQSTEISGKSKDDWCVYETGINSILASRVVCWWYQLPEV
jgi:hypothetical protein